MSSQHQKYIVVFKDTVTKEEVEKYAKEINENGGEVTNRYDSVLNGFAAHVPDSFFQSFKGDDAIDYIGAFPATTDQEESELIGVTIYTEPDGVVTTQ
ncbi:hypothetical protein DXG01_007861 [Tephrocybe rancida]|nr:hypothetical protein DXG01_007861 [Tephrocybe rancida]